MTLPCAALPPSGWQGSPSALANAPAGGQRTTTRRVCARRNSRKPDLRFFARQLCKRLPDTQKRVRIVTEKYHSVPANLPCGAIPQHPHCPPPCTTNKKTPFAQGSLFYVRLCFVNFPDKHCICIYIRKIRHSSFEIYRILAKLSFRATLYCHGAFDLSKVGEFLMDYSPNW